MPAISQFTGPFMVCLLLTSCATLTEDERAERMYDRDDELILAREEFERKSRECSRNGGSMQLAKHSSSRFKKPDAHDYKMAECMRY